MSSSPRIVNHSSKSPAMGKRRKRHKPASKLPTENSQRAKRPRTKVMSEPASEPALAPIAQAATQAPSLDEQPNTSSAPNDWGSRRQRDAVLAQTLCEACGWYHQGDSQETLDSLVKLSEEAAVLFDRDVAAERKVAELCGPRFRQSGFNIDAHYGHPRGQRYVVYRWLPGTPADE